MPTWPAGCSPPPTRPSIGGSTSGPTWPTVASHSAPRWQRSAAGSLRSWSGLGTAAGTPLVWNRRPCQPLRCCRAGGWWRIATYNTPIQTTVSYPLLGLSGLLQLVTVVDKFRPQAVEEKGSVCRPPSSPLPIATSGLIQVWMRLPAPNRQRLLWLLSQLLEPQLSAAAAPGEDGDESAPRH